ncbi:MAG TPA: hypothetical protein VG897_08590, partial [Terriglobales bacterium]|nr:hypothetical protein [Terriglobales bacterium]
RFNTAGAVWGLVFGLVGSIVLIFIGPSIMGVDGKHFINHAPIFPLENPGILSVPIGFVGAILGTLLGGHEETAEEKFTELQVRANTGIGAEKALVH